MLRPATGHRVRSRWRELASLPVSELPLVFSRLLTVPDSDSCALIYSPARTFWLFVHQILLPGSSCQEMVHKALVWLFAGQRAKASTNSSGYCQARARLDLVWIIDLARGLASRLERQAKGLLWHGRRVFVVDGSSASMPDTLANQARWPQPAGQKPGCGFPVIRIVALFCLASGVAVDFSTGPLELHEGTLWRRLWGRLRRGDVIVADRGFSSFAEFYLLLARGIDMVARMHACRTVNVRFVKRLGKGDRLVEWSRDRHSPRWLDWAYKRSLPKTLIVREITVRIAIPGFRTQAVTLATTLLDPKEFPAEDLAALYRKRWQAELYLRDLKTSMGMEVLSCKSPQMIEKELAMYWLAYNLVRGLMLEAALAHTCEPTRLSFQSCAAIIRQWAPRLANAQTARELNALRNCMLSYLAAQRLRSKPDRVEPRALKPRPKSYARLTKPRHQFVDIPHRNHYKKQDITSQAAAA